MPSTVLASKDTAESKKKGLLLWSLLLSREEMLLINQITIKCQALPTSSSCHLPPMSTSFFPSLSGHMKIRGEVGNQDQKR